MAIGSRYSRERRKRRGQFLLRVAKWLLLLCVLLGLGAAAYRGGLELARLDVRELESRLDEVATEARGLHQRNATLESDLRQAREAIAAHQQRYQRDVPTGDAAALYALAQQRVAAGIPPARIEQVLRDAGPVHRCEARGSSRRFAIAYGPRVPDNAGIELLDGLVRVVVSAPDTATDLARTANVVVSLPGAEPRSLTGLPQRLPIALGNAELTLNVVSEIRGFATATLTGC